jgi:hypothetical protein
MILLLLDQPGLSEEDADLLQLAAESALLDGELAAAGEDELAAVQELEQEGAQRARAGQDGEQGAGSAARGRVAS